MDKLSQVRTLEPFLMCQCCLPLLVALADILCNMYGLGVFTIMAPLDLLAHSGQWLAKANRREGKARNVCGVQILGSAIAAGGQKV